MSEKTKEEQIELARNDQINTLIPSVTSCYDIRADEFRYFLNGVLLSGAFKSTPEFVKDCNDLTWDILTLIRKHAVKS